MKTSRFFWTFGLLTVLLVALTSPASGGQEKVDVCHITGTYDFGQGEVPIGHVISIADPAYETHIAHGDPEVWELRTLPDGSEVCTATVNPVNSPPIALDDAYSTDEDTTLSVSVVEGVLYNDADQDGDSLSAVLDTGPSNGALTLYPDGSFTYTPDADYAGTDSFTYHANDGALDSNTSTVTLTVNPVNDAPTAADDAYSTDEDVALTISALGVLGNDGDVDGDSPSAVLDAGPTHGSLEFPGDGGFTYTPNADYYGLDSFTYHASDDTLDSNIAIVILTVDPVNDAPTAADDAYSTDEDVALTVPGPGVLANDGDVDTDSLSAVLVTGPSNGELTLNEDGDFTYTPDADYDGTDSFTYHASDGALGSNIATVTIIVNPVSEPPTGMIVFVTSGAYQGQSLGGLDGADAICQDRANDAGLGGTFKAWLSTEEVSAADRLAHSDVPYVLADGTTQVAANWADLVDGIDHAIDQTEWGAFVSNAVYVLTNTSNNGTSQGAYDCYDWTGNYPEPPFPPSWAGYTGYAIHWSEYDTGQLAYCDIDLHLYCFQQ
jgi:VCBS repeat-containing protein